MKQLSMQEVCALKARGGYGEFALAGVLFELFTEGPHADPGVPVGFAGATTRIGRVAAAILEALIILIGRK